MKLEYEIRELGDGWMPEDKYQTVKFQDDRCTGWCNHPSLERAEISAIWLDARGYKRRVFGDDEG